MRKKAGGASQDASNSASDKGEMVSDRRSEGCQPIAEGRHWKEGGNLNLSWRHLQRCLVQEESPKITYAYVIDSVENRDGILCQTGCGPNFLGGRITLCTCKHYMRSFGDKDSWKGKWVAGFTNVRAGQGRNILVYLMRIERAFRSHYQLWKTFLREPGGSFMIAAKNTQHSMWGDIYKPSASKADWAEKDEYAPENYNEPIKGHRHEGSKWKGDIACVNRQGLRPALLLVGDPWLSFLWTRPRLRLLLDNKRCLTQGQKKFQGVWDLLGSLKEV